MSDEKPVPETLATIAEKIIAVGKSVDERFARVDARFAQIDARFAQVDARFAQLDARFARVDARFADIDTRFDEVAEAFVEQRKYTEFAFATLRAEVMGEMKGGFGRLDRKLDRVLDVLAGTRSARRRRRS